MKHPDALIDAHPETSVRIPIIGKVQQLASVIAVAAAVISLNLGRVLVGIQNQFIFTFSVAVAVLVISLWSVIALPSTAGDSLRK